MCLSRGVEVGQDATGLDLRAAGVHLDANIFHEREIDHESVIANGVAGDVMSTAPDRDDQLLLVPELDRLHDIFGRGAAGDNRGFAVDHGVPDLPHLIVIGISGKKHISPEVRFEFLQLGF